MNAFALALGIGFALSPAISSAVTDELLPCAGHVCLGEEASSLKDIPWASASGAVGTKLSRRQIRHLETIYKGRFDNIAPFLQKGIFDRHVLGELHGIRAACRSHDLIGQFASEDGNPTRVTLRMLPDERGQQTWRVVAISREFPQAKSRAQQEKVREMLDARYGRYDIHRRRSEPGRAGYLYAWLGQPTMLLSLTLPIPRVLEARFARHPLCESPSRLSID